MPVLDPSRFAPTAWRNGAGLTRHVWASERAWVSVAELVADAPFSGFPGRDRVFVPETGAFTLVIDGEDVPAVRHRPILFPGEATVRIRGLVSPTRALNVMTRRGAATAEIEIVPADSLPRLRPTLSVQLADHVAHVRIVPEHVGPASSL